MILVIRKIILGNWLRISVNYHKKINMNFGFRSTSASEEEQKMANAKDCDLTSMQPYVFELPLKILRIYLFHWSELNNWSGWSCVGPSASRREKNFLTCFWFKADELYWRTVASRNSSHIYLTRTSDNRIFIALVWVEEPGGGKRGGGQILHTHQLFKSYQYNKFSSSNLRGTSNKIE